MEKLIKKEAQNNLYKILKFDHFNDKNVIMKKNEKKKKTTFEKQCKK